MDNSSQVGRASVVGERVYSFTSRLTEDYTRPTVILMPLLAAGSSSADLSYLLERKITPSHRSGNATAGSVNTQRQDPSLDSRSTNGSDEGSPTTANHPYVKVFHRTLIRLEAKHYWYSSRGPVSLPSPPIPPANHQLPQKVVFAHWNYVTGQFQFWRRSLDPGVEWQSLEWGDTENFEGEVFYFSWTASGDPSWVRWNRFTKKRNEQRTA